MTGARQVSKSILLNILYRAKVNIINTSPLIDPQLAQASDEPMLLLIALSWAKADWLAEISNFVRKAKWFNLVLIFKHLKLKHRIRG